MAMKIGRAARTLSSGLGSLLASRGTALPSLGARSFHTDNTKLTVAHFIARNYDLLLFAGAFGLGYWFDVGGKRADARVWMSKVWKSKDLNLVINQSLSNFTIILFSFMI